MKVSKDIKGSRAILFPGPHQSRSVNQRLCPEIISFTTFAYPLNILQPSLNHPMNPTNPSKSSEIPSIADGETYIPHIYTYITDISRKSQSFHGQLSSFSCLRIRSSGLKRSYEGADAVTPWAVGARYRRSPGESASA